MYIINWGYGKFIYTKIVQIILQLNKKIMWWSKIYNVIIQQICKHLKMVEKQLWLQKRYNISQSIKTNFKNLLTNIKIKWKI